MTGASPDSSDLVEITLALDGEAAEAVCALFRQHGGGAVVESRPGDDGSPPEHWVSTYIPADDPEARARLEIGLWHLGRIYPMPETGIRTVARADWAEAWKQHYRPLRVGARFVVTPSWIDPRPTGDALVIRLDPGMAFGTGLHPTTQLCLAALERVVAPGDAVLDVGTGSGILAIAAMLLGASRAVGVDLDPAAAEIAAANARANGVLVETLVGGLDQAPSDAYDVVVANLLAATVTDLARPLLGRTRPGGTCVASGILSEQAPAVTSALQAAGFHPPVTASSGDWVALTVRRPAARR